MKRIKTFNLQLFAEGGGAGAGSAAGSEVSGTGETAAEGVADPKKGGKDTRPLANVVYGRVQDKGESPAHKEEPAKSSEMKAEEFEKLIKGEYREEFSKRTQGIIDERFKAMKGLEETLKTHDPLHRMLADKYGVKDPADVKALIKAIEDDESFYEKEALEQGLSVKQLKEMKRLQRENESFRAAQAEAERQKQGEKIYSQWLEEGNAFAERYGIQNFDFNAEIQNPDFTKLLANGISVEGAYKAVHFDEMVGGAMAQTASNVREKMAANVTARSQRPQEGAASSQTATIFKQDVTKLTKSDRDEIERRVLRGDTISF